MIFVRTLYRDGDRCIRFVSQNEYTRCFVLDDMTEITKKNYSFLFLGPKMNGVFISFVAVLFTVLSISTEATPVAAGGELNNNGKKILYYTSVVI